MGDTTTATDLSSSERLIGSTQAQPLGNTGINAASTDDISPEGLLNVIS
jgi:hypothetical protein